MKIALTIAGSDTSGGAGIQADLRVFADFGVYGLSTVAAVTSQNSKGVQKINLVPPRIVAAQIDSVTRDIGTDACKIGMLYNEEVVSRVAERISRRSIPNVVLDPMVFAKDDTRLLKSKAVIRMKHELIPKCTLVTPNLPEVETFTKISVDSIETAKEAAKAIHGMGASHVLIKGGHFEGEPIDILFDGESFIEYKGRRIEGKRMHGTGCVLSAAIAASLALGKSIPDAVQSAKEYVTRAIEASVKLGKGEMWYYTGSIATNTDR